MSLKVIEAIDNHYKDRSSDLTEFGGLVDDHWPAIKTYIETVETGLNDGTLSPQSLELGNKLEETRKLLGQNNKKGEKLYGSYITENSNVGYRLHPDTINIDLDNANYEQLCTALSDCIECSNFEYPETKQGCGLAVPLRNKLDEAIERRFPNKEMMRKAAAFDALLDIFIKNSMTIISNEDGWPSISREVDFYSGDYSRQSSFQDNFIRAIEAYPKK